MSDPIVIVSALRTPLGAFQGALSSLKTTALGSIALKAAAAQAQLDPVEIDEVFMGCVLPAGLGQAPARQASRGAGFPDSVGAVTLNKVCGSAMKAVMLGHDSILAGTNQVVLAGGMESMSNTPYILEKARNGYRLGHGEIKDHMFLDGLEDAYEKRLMGCYAEETAKAYGFTRADQDAFALQSLTRAQDAQQNNAFEWEITPVVLQDKKGTTEIAADEGPTKAKPEKIPTLKPAFAADGTVTAANSSSISDGAAALCLMRQSEAARRGLNPLATIRGHATFSQQPGLFTTAPVGALKRLGAKVGWELDSVDLFEINEAFAVVTMAAMKDLNLPSQKVNVHGGACALGHPIGASGARILVTLIHALHTHEKERGMAAICLGGGEAVAVAVEI